MEQIYVTLEQIRLIKHTLGFSKDKVKRGKYQAYRNYYCAGGIEEEFEELVEMELAVKAIRQEQVYYFITAKGIQLLADFTEVKITEMD